MDTIGTIHRSVGVTYVESPLLIQADAARELFSAAVLACDRMRREGMTYSDEYSRLSRAAKRAAR